MVAVRY